MLRHQVKGAKMAVETAAAEGEGGLVFHPMDQFIVEPLFGDGPVHWYTITNATLWMALAVVAVVALMVLATEDVAGKDAVGFFPYVMTLFMFIVFANFLGLIPMSFTTTSHFAVTVVLALAVFLTVTIYGFMKNGTKFLGLF